MTEKEFLAALARKLGRAPLASPPPRPGHGRMKPPPAPNMAAREARADWFTRELGKLTGTVARAGSLTEAGQAAAAYVAEHCTPGGEVMLWNDPVALSAQEPLERAGFTVHVGGGDRMIYARSVAGITSALLGVAETGSIALAASPVNKRLTSLLPPVHIAILPTSRLLATVGEYFRTAAGLERMPAALNLITGPSRTADIELELAIGVHGPGALHVVLFDD